MHSLMMGIQVKKALVGSFVMETSKYVLAQTKKRMASLHNMGLLQYM